MREVHNCSECGEPHIVQQAHKEVLNKHKLTMLKAAAQHVMDTQRNDFKLSELDEISNYNNFQKLRYHGLVHHVRKNGVWLRGHWLITRNGWAFLRGELDLPKFVKVKNNSIVERSLDLINVRHVYYGSEVVNTTFEYFDDDGRPVAIRPLNRDPNSRQQALL